MNKSTQYEIIIILQPNQHKTNNLHDNQQIMSITACQSTPTSNHLSTQVSTKDTTTTTDTTTTDTTTTVDIIIIVETTTTTTSASTQATAASGVEDQDVAEDADLEEDAVSTISTEHNSSENTAGLTDHVSTMDMSAKPQ